MKSIAHLAAIFPAAGFTEHVAARHPAPPPTYLKNSMGSSFSFSFSFPLYHLLHSSSSLYLSFPWSLEANSRALGQTVIKTAR